MHPIINSYINMSNVMYGHGCNKNFTYLLSICTNTKTLICHEHRKSVVSYCIYNIERQDK